MIYAAHKGPVSLKETPLVNSRVEEVSLQTEDGIELHGWLSFAQLTENSDERSLVILFPGNAGNRSYRAAIMQDFNRCGSDCLIFDYRGYADNAGTPSEPALTTDALKIWDFTTQSRQYSPQRIVLCGESLGGGVATRLAWELCQRETPPAGLILRTTFTSLTDVAARFYPWLPVRTLLVDRYPSIDLIGQITCPIFVIHGRRDQITPFPLGEALFAAAPATSASGVPRTFLDLPATGHNDVQLTAADAVHQGHLNFLRAVLPEQKKPVTPEIEDQGGSR